MNRFILSIFFVLTFFGCHSVKQFNRTPVSPDGLSQVPREFRAAWVATVVSINWPKDRNALPDTQKETAIAILDSLALNNFNAVIFQVRPQSDALYKSNYEAWSYYLTGEQGKAPEPFYDPLEFWVEEAHKRGLELHVWLNPYRAHHKEAPEINYSSIVKTHPDWVLKLSSGYYWLDPGLREVQQHCKNVVYDLTERYDIDGVHFDDYFYPYPSYHDKDFPDDKSWKIYKNGGGKLNRANWRRKNVDDLVRDLYKGIKKRKPYVKFGLSPFGIWKPGYPAGISGMNQYEKLYADAKLWLNEGWVDYFTPQLYWSIGRYPQSFPLLLGWWEKENTQSRHLWPGISTTRKAGNPEGIQELINEIMVTRGMVAGSPGNAHWSMAGLINSEYNYGKALREGPYRTQALIPASPWLGKTPPAKPQIIWNSSENQLKINAGKDAFVHVIYLNYGRFRLHKVIPMGTQVVDIEPFITRTRKDEDGKKEAYKISLERAGATAISRLGVESEVVFFK